MKIKVGMKEKYNHFIKINTEDKDERVYAMGIISFTKRWASLMENELAKKKSLTKKMVEKLSNEADTEGITGFMYDMARTILYNFWEYGSQLKDILGTKSCSILTISTE